MNSTSFVRFYVVSMVQLLGWNNYVGYNFIFLLLRIIPRKSIIKFYDVLCYKTYKNLTKYMLWKYMWRSDALNQFLHNVKMKKHVSTNEMAAFNRVHVSKYLSLIMIINFSVLWQTFPRPRSMQLKLGNRNWWIFYMSRVVGYSPKHNNNLRTNFMVCRGPTLQLSTCTFNRLMQSIFKILIFKIS